jgi:cytochrome c biogenesis protein CcdA
MADTRPTPASPWRAFLLCVKLLIDPKLIVLEEEKDAQLRKMMGDRPVNLPHRALAVRRAFFDSLLLVLLFASLGYGVGIIMAKLGRCATVSTTAWLQIGGTCLLLWGTLFIRGWEIQTLSGVSLTERINQWLYRALYCLGTGLLVYSLAFAPCK